MKMDKTYKQRFMDGFDILCHTRHKYKVWSDCMLLFATAIANPLIAPLKENKQFADVWNKREKQYLDVINQYNKKEQKIIAQMMALLVMEYEREPYQDLLGTLYMQLGVSNNKSGQFFTPYSVCKLMVDVTMERKQIGKIVHKEGYASVYDGAVGAGATLIAAAEKCSEMFKKYNYQNHVYFVGQDIDICCVNMCYIQLSLLGVAGYVICASTLTKPEIDLKKGLGLVWFTPIWFSDIWTMRRFFHSQDLLGRRSMRK